jgi:hypothetical protein
VARVALRALKANNGVVAEQRVRGGASAFLARAIDEQPQRRRLSYAEN